MDITVNVDLGEDRGQNFGTLFEACDSEGRPVFGAGFSGVYNTRFRMDRYALQFFVRDDDAPVVFERLPPPSEDGGTYLFNLDDRVYQFSHYQDGNVRWWDEASGAWKLDETFGLDMQGGEGKMRVAGEVLQFRGGEAWYEGVRILNRPEAGHYHHFYYANGQLAFFHNGMDQNPAFSRLYAVPWVPGGPPANLEEAITLDVKYPGETPFAIGQFGDQIVNSSNMGGVYVLDESAWRVVRSPQKGVSFQLYSMLNWYDKLLMSQYPTGNLFEYDGDQMRHLENCPPVMPGVSDRAREAQTTCLYGGDLYVGVWPWAELWSHNLHDDSWQFIKRMFNRPEITDRMDHPFEDQVRDYNQVHDEELVWNNWGQRITGLTPMGDALYISVSAKGCQDRDMRLEFLHDDDLWNEYRAVYRMRKPGCAVAAIEWTGKPMELRFTVTDDRIEIGQDGNVIASASVGKQQTDQLPDAEIEWGQGMFGPLRAALGSRSVTP